MINRRSGLTMLEVIFSMVVILVGLVSIAFLIPLAGRQAEDSQQITQGLAAGDSALALFNTANIAQPTLESPWCLVDDVGVTEYSVSGMKDAYNAVANTAALPTNPIEATKNQNRVAGIGFCIDPLFWGFQQPTNTIPAPFFRTRFPYLFDSTNPVSMVADQQTIPPSPRLLRVSLTSPTGVAAGSWLRQPAAIALATMYGGDVVQPSSTKNKAIGPLRSVYIDDKGTIDTSDDVVLSSPSSSQQMSWMATVTPSDSNATITRDKVQEWVAQNGLGIAANYPLDIPRLYDVALVVFAKRDARDVNSILAVPNQVPPISGIPKSELVFNVVEISDDAITSGAFNITIQGSPGTDSEVKVGNWLMMSRFTFEDVLPRIANELSGRPSQFYKRQIHRWYRVIGVSEAGNGGRVLRVSGKPWGWTEREIEMMQAYPANGNGSYPPSVPPRMLNSTGAAFPVFPFDLELRAQNIPPVIQAVVLKDVVQVYERQMELR